MGQARKPIVLVVEDEYQVRTTAVDLLKNLGCDVLEARDGIEALDTLYDRPDITVLFSDCRMPRMNGLELAQMAKRLRPGLRIVLSSGYTSSDPKGWPLVPKPYRSSDLARVVS